MGKTWSPSIKPRNNALTKKDNKHGLGFFFFPPLFFLILILQWGLIRKSNLFAAKITLKFLRLT